MKMLSYQLCISWEREKSILAILLELAGGHLLYRNPTAYIMSELGHALRIEGGCGYRSFDYAGMHRTFCSWLLAVVTTVKGRETANPPNRRRFGL